MNRPARRYLYFRFVLTYLWAKSQGNLSWAERVETRKVFWATPRGPYLHKSTLLSLARDISGVELPSSLYEGKVFERPAKAREPEEELIFAAKLRKAFLKENWDERSDEEYEASDKE